MTGVQTCALPIFASLYFLVFAKKQKLKNPNRIKIKSKKNLFFMGMVFAAINFFPIPYYVFISVTLASYQLFIFDRMSVYCFVSGVLVGSFLVFYCYVVFFEKFKSKTDFLVKNMNTILGTITAIVAVLSLLNVLNYYF